MAELKLSYYEKKESDNAKGVIDLAKVTKLAKTGKTPTEFMIEILDDATGPKVFTLQAPAVAQMELWIKAIGIVKEAAKRKAASKQEASNTTQAATPSTASPSTTPATTTNSAPSSDPKTSINTTPEAETVKVATPEPSTGTPTSTSSPAPSQVETPPSPRKSSSSTEKLNSQPKASTATSPTTTSPKLTSPIAPRPSGPKSGGSFLASQRASMHPAIASPAKSNSPSQVSALTSQFEAPAKTNGAARWSTALTPSNSAKATTNTTPTSSSTTQAAPSSVPAPVSPTESSSSASKSKSSEKPRTASIPSSSPSNPPANGSEKIELPQQASLPPAEPKPSSIPSVAQLASSTEIKSPSPAPAEPAKPEAPLPIIEDTFKLGDKEVFVRSSLSSQAAQPVGQMLLSDSASLETSEPLVRASNGASSLTEQLRASDSIRQRPAVPSPMSILEQEINRSYDQETHTPPPVKERENVISAQTPDALMVLLRHAKIHPDREVYIQLGERVLLGYNGTWIAQDTYFKTDNLRDLEADFDPETGYTWHLPGFLQIRWYRHNTWSITSREASPSDEIKWNLLGVGKLLEDFNKFMSVPRQALVYHLYSSVHKIMEETLEVRESYDIPLEQQGEKLATPEIELLVRRDLCTRLAAVLLDGFNDWSIFRKYHIYDFIHSAGLDRLNVSGFGALQLPLVIADVESSSEDSNVRFRNFVVAALNQRLLYTWMAHMFKNQPQVSDYYEDESLVRQISLVILNALAPLSSIAFHIPLETANKR